MHLLEYLLAAVGMYCFAHLVGKHDLLRSVGIVFLHLLVGEGDDLEPVRIPSKQASYDSELGDGVKGSASGWLTLFGWRLFRNNNT